MAPEDTVDAVPPEAARIELGLPEAEEQVTPRPGRLRRFAAGAWHVPGGAAFLLMRPRLWGMALLPGLLGMAAVVVGLMFGIYGVPGVEMRIGAHRPRLPDLLDLVADLGLWMGTLGAGVLGALALALIVSAPMMDWLQRRAERLAGGNAPAAAPGRHEALRALRHSLYLLLLVPPAFVVALIPFIGPPLAGAFIALVLTFQLTALPLARRGLDVNAMREWHREWRAETLGFGVAALLLLPLLTPILAPALATGAALLVQETYGDAAS